MRLQNIASLLILSGGLYLGYAGTAAFGQRIDTSSPQTIDAGFATADDGPSALARAQDIAAQIRLETTDGAFCRPLTFLAAA